MIVYEATKAELKALEGDEKENQAKRLQKLGNHFANFAKRNDQLIITGLQLNSAADELNASGKTNVVNLLLRFYDPDSGVIELDGTNINDIPKYDLRKNIAIVLQDAVLFETTIAENIKYGKDDATIEENVAREGVLYNPHFLLERINFEGNTKVSEEELNKLALEILGEDIFFDELLEVCSKVTNLYHEKGFLTSYATVPPQRIVDGLATIKIVESNLSYFSFHLLHYLL